MSEDEKSAPGEEEAGAEELIRFLSGEIDRLRAELEANNNRIEELERLADTDPLTPTMNRRAFLRELGRTAAYIGRYGGEAWLMFLDLDGMKSINDRYGHAAGDDALKLVADALLANLRSSDAVGRLGGDEFGVILHQAGEATATEKAAALKREIAETELMSGGERVALSVSCGVARVEPGLDVTAILEKADAAMYAAKETR